MTTNSATLTAADIYDQIAEWEGAPPAYLCTYPLADVTAVVVEFTEIAAHAPNMTVPEFWMSVDLFELQRIAARDAAAFRLATGENPW
jgi:hypothetical protein